MLDVPGQMDLHGFAAGAGIRRSRSLYAGASGPAAVLPGVARPESMAAGPRPAAPACDSARARSECARWMYMQGVGVVRIMRHGTWRNVAELERYIRATGNIREAKTREALLGRLQPGEAPPPIAGPGAGIDDACTQVVGASQRRPVAVRRPSRPS